MADETTPLTGPSTSSGVTHGPEYVFPGGVSPRARRNKMTQFQCYICWSVLTIILSAIVIAFIVTEYNDFSPTPVVELAANTNTTVAPLTDTQLRHLLEDQVTPIRDEPNTQWAIRPHSPFNQTNGDEAVNAGIKALGDREIMEENSQTTPPNTPAFRHYRSLNTNAEARKLARRGFVENQATQHIAELYNYTKAEGRHNIGRGPRITLPDSTLEFKCDFNERYRRSNGICNNKLHPRYYGAAMVPYRRMVLPDYADGISLPRASHSGAELPSAREVSLKIHRAAYETDSNFTVMLAVFGQFLDHDITATSLTTTQEGESINCCTVPLNTHPECFPVIISPDDRYFSQFNVTCMNFVRSAPAPTGHFGPRQQLNQATAFIDGSVVYGSNEQRQHHLRTMMNGTLRMYFTEDGRQLLPISTLTDDGCNRPQMLKEGKYCFESGDDRANENLLLTSMHLLWARHHNYLARGLQAENPDWDDETVFQEARRILSAQMAHIAYNEFLPILFGRELAEKKGFLSNMGEDAPDTYNHTVDPTIANCFAAASFRFAHSILPSLFNMTRNTSVPQSVELHKLLFNPFSLWPKGGIDSAMETAYNTPVQQVDRFLSLELTEKLFESNAPSRIPVCGLDLVSLNIQRGRDHGLPAYPVFRKHCKLPSVDTWEEMATAIEPESLESIKAIYKTPYDVDVYTGALSEPPLKGAIFGPLLTCLVSDQFLRLKIGDSHWYERKMGPQRFTKDQLKEIHKTTLSAIICQNSDSVTEIQRYVMERSNEETVDCNDIKNFNFTAWHMGEMGFTQLHRSSLSNPSANVRVMEKATTATAAATNLLPPAN